MGFALLLLLTFGLLLAALVPRMIGPAWVAPVIALGYTAAVGVIGTLDNLDWLAAALFLLAVGFAGWSVLSRCRAAWVSGAGKDPRERVLLMLGLTSLRAG